MSVGFRGGAVGMVCRGWSLLLLTMSVVGEWNLEQGEEVRR